MHRDIKLENFFLDFNNKTQQIVVKLGDFGCSKIGRRGKNFTGIIGSTFAMAPEMIKGEKYSEKVDCWSLGILLYELLTNEVPF